MDLSLRDRLKRLGVSKGVAGLAPRAPAERPPAEPADPARLWNVDPQTMFGPTRIRRTPFALDHVHGNRALGEAVAQPFHGVDPRSALYLDTETTGLAGGTGTLAFLVGVGYFEGDAFVVDQYFLRDPAEELALLAHLDARVARQPALVTFNGKAFDVPLLETRFALQRIAPQFREKQHLDLLAPARQVWRGAFVDCRLGTLEHHLLEVRRTQEDIAGFLVPQIYREYLMAGSPDAHDDMRRVMYHNLHDIVSMVTLVARLRDAFEQPLNAHEQAAVGAAAARSGDHARAAAMLSRAIDTAQGESLRPTPATQRNRGRLAESLKRLERRDEAVEQWQMLAVEGDMRALEELAKHYEWHARDYASALKCAERGVAVSRDPITRGEWQKRVERLQRKLKPAV